MTKHTYQLFMAPDGVTLSDANEFLESWHRENHAWAGDPDDALLEEYTRDGTVFWNTMFRFHPVHTDSELLGRLNELLQNNSVWFVAWYHVCENDEKWPGNCSIDVIYVWPDIATVPSVIEDVTRNKMDRYGLSLSEDVVVLDTI